MNKKKILIIQLRPGLGDLCMFLPRCHEIGEKYPNHEITLLTKQNTKAKDVLKHDPHIQKIEFIDDKKIKKNLRFLINLFFRNKFELVFSYQYGPKYLKYLIFSKLSGVKKIYFYGIFKKKEDMTKKSILSNEIWLNIKVKNYNPKIFLQKTYENKNDNSVVIGLGASGDNKRWPIEYFIELINMLSILNFDKFLLAAGKNEENLIKKIKESIANKKINLISMENLNVYDSMQLIRLSNFFIGNDTGFMHVSACLGLKTFCLYGDTPSKDSEYNHNIIPIMPPGVKEVYHNDLSMDKIKPDYVFNIIKKSLTLG